VVADNDCFRGLNPAAVCGMLQAIAPWPSVGARIRSAWPWLSLLQSCWPTSSLQPIPICYAANRAEAVTRYLRLMGMRVP
jgi:hypothetical protein